MTNDEINYKIRVEPQPTGGFSVVLIFEPHKNKSEAVAEARDIAHNLRQIGWECERVQ